MRFCANCNNMLYLQLMSDKVAQLNYYCRSCGAVEDHAHTVADQGICVLNTQFKKGEQRFNHIINRYTKLDPTLPRIYNIKCPNGQCKTNEEDATALAEETRETEIIYMRYDEDNMKYLYICVACDTIWKTDDAKA